MADVIMNFHKLTRKEIVDFLALDHEYPSDNLNAQANEHFKKIVRENSGKFTTQVIDLYIEST